MKCASLLILVSTVSVSQTFGGDWDYPFQNSTVTITGKNNAGKTGYIQHYQTLTRDNPENVILWYAKKIGISETDSLVKDAKAGFHEMHKVNKGAGTVIRNTKTEKWKASYFWIVSSKNASMHIFLRPESDAERDLTISITKTEQETDLPKGIAPTPNGTAISVFRSVPPEATKSVAKAK